MLVEWSKNKTVTSKSIHQYGSNTQHESSIHYNDQVNLFVNKKFKPAWRTLQDIKDNLERAYTPGEK